MKQSVPHRWLLAVGAVAIGIGACGGGGREASPPAASAQIERQAASSAPAVSAGTYRLKNACDGRYLGLRNGAPKPWDNAVLQAAGSPNAVAWQIEAAADGSVALKAAGTQSALQTAYGATSEQTDVDLWIYGGAASQRWFIDDMGGGAVRLTLAAARAMALDAQYAGQGSDEVWLYADNGSCAQRWTLEAAGSPPSGAADAFAMMKKLGRGINFGNILEASPAEGSWGLTLSDTLFDKAREGGFATLRLPVRWSNHAQTSAPYTVNEGFFQRVDYAIDAALSRGLNIVVNMHHHRQLCGEALDNGEPTVSAQDLDDRFVAMWAQIAQRYRDQPADRVLFELYNEPNTGCTPARWNGLLQRALSEVRKSNPQRYVVVGPTSWNGADALKDLVLPDSDQRLIVTIHNYNPFTFTHQGASWASGSDQWLGTTCCSAAQVQDIQRPLDVAQQWGGTRRPIWLGEFGAYEAAPYDSRVRYARVLRDEAERRGMSWAYWEMAAGFGIWNPNAQAWRTELRDALTGP
jgi:endoglucanase